MIVWVIAGLLGLATGLRIGWALVNKQSLVSTAMIVALGSLGLVAALNWHPLTLLIDTALGWPNIAMALSQVALIACAAGSFVMITTVVSNRAPATVRRIATAQYAIAAVIALAAVVAFFQSGRQPEMSPEEYLKRNLGGAYGTVWLWLLPLLYILAALTLVSWAGLRHSSRSRRGRALFIFSLGTVLIVAASAFLLLRAVSPGGPIGVGVAATLLGCAMLVVAAGSLLPSVEDWFGARRELRIIEPLLDELSRRHPDIGIGVRPRGPLAFRVAERMSLISDGLFLEASSADASKRRSVDTAAVPAGEPNQLARSSDFEDLEPPPVPAQEQARTLAEWVYAGRGAAQEEARRLFPGLNWVRQPESYSDREWILAIAEQYRDLARSSA